MFKNFSANIITKKTNATIIPEFKTRVEGFGFLSLIFFMKKRVNTKIKEITSTS
jgi:hypothetical protein